jgi:general secretion pathway protein K
MKRERGIALLTAVILVALATIVAAAIAFDTAMTSRRAIGGAELDQSLAIAQGAEALAAFAIGEQLRSGPVIATFQQWAQPIGNVEVAPGALLAAQVTDLQGRFNLNDLVDDEGKRNDVAVEVFQRLLQAVGLEPDWAAAMVDWIDADTNPEPGGAEDTVYSSERPPYRTPNRAIVSASEILALKDFGAERYAKIAGEIAALPRGTPVNLCTASGALLDALSNQKQWTGAAAALATNRKAQCFPDVATLQRQVDPQTWTKLTTGLKLVTTSQFFQLRTVATIGTSEFALYSLLGYEGAGGSARVRVIFRGFTE